MFLISDFVPTHLTLTANKGETVHLNMQLLSSQKRDVTWKYNGKPVYATQGGGRKFNTQLRDRPLITTTHLQILIKDLEQVRIEDYFLTHWKI